MVRFTRFTAPIVAVLGLAFAAACSDDSSLTSPDASGVALHPSSHESGTVVVWPGDMRGWFFLQETPNGSGQMVAGPDSPPLGAGSANLIVDATGGVILGVADYAGTPLADIDALTYSTYRTSGSAALAIALQINVDVDLTDANTAWQGRLVYEPYYTHAVVTGDWQNWDTQDDAGNGNWWFTGAPGNATCPIGNPCTWSEVLAAFPNAGVHPTLGAIGLKAGGNWGGFDGNTDALTVGIAGGNTVTYDFELANDPADKNDCKKGGWAQYGFRNQGQCIKFVNTGKDSR